MNPVIRVVLAALSITFAAGCSHSSKILKDAPESCRVSDQEFEEKESSNPLMTAILEGNVDQVQKLLSSQKNIQQYRDGLGLSYLHLAAGVGNPEIIELLVNAGIPVNLRSGKRNSTPAHSAVSWKKV